MEVPDSINLWASAIFSMGKRVIGGITRLPSSSHLRSCMNIPFKNDFFSNMKLKLKANTDRLSSVIFLYFEWNRSALEEFAR